MYFNNSIFGGVRVGCSVGLLLPVMDFIGMLHVPIRGTFSPGVCIPLHGLYGDVPPDRVWFFTPLSLI